MKKNIEVLYRWWVLIFMKGIFHRSHAPHKSRAGSSELNVRGNAVPPVSPEVIKILLFQRSCRLMDTPSEHVFSR
ncbi:MAG: hypothetical protein KA807_06695 [Prolixibacteraceae bacterium]|nr:hypothetical protein [Prolixibacteraceae bacterium]